MADEELRRRERAAAANYARCLEHARSLERVGRRDDAHVALVSGLRDWSVREELARYPAWTHADGDAGATRAIDVRLPRTAPELSFAVDLLDPLAELLTGPGLVVATGVAGRTVVVDPLNGDEVARLPGRAIGWDGPLLVVRDGLRLTWLDPPYRVVSRLEDPSCAVATVRDGLLVTRGDDTLRAWTRAHDGRHVERWSRAISRSPRVRDPLLAGGAVVVFDPEREVLHAFDAATGDERFSAPGTEPRLDERGLVFVDRSGQLEARDLAGAGAWALPGRSLRAIDAAHAISEPGQGRFVLRARDTGAALAPLELGLLRCELLLARDVLLAWSNEPPSRLSPIRERTAPYLAAFDLQGALLWRVALEVERVLAVAPLAGRLYVLGEASGARTLLCLET